VDFVKNRYTGLLVPPKDPVALADAVLELAQDGRLRSEIIGNAYSLVKREFNWEVITDRVEAAYRSILDIPGGGSS
jgi:glycosyltransferase involved in cell wall biosynthesis